MKILHYSLGLPPFRSGGLTKYSVDLIKEQSKQGYDVFLLYPGSINRFKKTTIENDTDFFGVKVYELINPLPISLLNGVKEVSYYYDKKDQGYFYKWLNKNRIEVIHIHTLMGLPLELILAAKQLNIRIIYTTHDYYGICPKVNLIRENGQICNNNLEFNICEKCCKNGLSYKKIIIMQSRIYRVIKRFSIGKKLIRLFKCNMIKNLKGELNSTNLQCKEEYAKEYKKLQEYYYTIFNNIDYFHFNSSVSKKVFEKYIYNIKGQVIPITHADIKDNRKLKNYKNEKIRILFLGNELPYKGLDMLKRSLKEIPSDKFILNVYGTDSIENKKNINYHGKYKYKDLEKIFEDNDIIIIPSIWFETFSLVALEAYSFGMPIILTDFVGFKDNIKNNETGFIIKPNENDLSHLLNSIINDKNKLREINKNILLESFELDIENHVKKIIKLYEE